MIRIWQLQEAKNKFSRVVQDAERGDHQIITKHGKEVAVVISYASYQRLAASGGRLSQFFAESPLSGSDLDLARDKSHARDAVEL